eukprot:TRINITY_DN1665_c0_g1_i1.p1 TRINITY_DN1665_c0_g1~~TRINITY_DN1665_c0_g1_i1.p1  ORF type:complete len:249 (-),score=52.94 TRINITY_DN1665_c0_g1_i1:80-826(-)
MSSEETFHGSVPRYDRHIVVFTNKLDWAKNIDDDNPFLKAFGDKIALKKSYMARKVKFSAAGAFGPQNDFGGAKEGTHNFAVFPDNIVYRNVTEDHLDGFIQDVLLENKPFDAAEQSPIPANEDGSKRHHIFVCTHMTRDARCGNLGPAILNALNEEVEKRNLSDKVHLYGISHVGGHHFAGNILFYPGGDWYGKMSPSEIPALLESVLDKKEVFLAHWRGRMGLVHEKQEQLFEDWECGNCSKALDW